MERRSIILGLLVLMGCEDPLKPGETVEYGGDDTSSSQNDPVDVRIINDDGGTTFFTNNSLHVAPEAPEGETWIFRWFQDAEESDIDTAMVSADATEKNQTWTVEVWSSDVIVGLATVGIANSPPSISSVRMDPDWDITSHSTVSCAAQDWTDLDEDENLSDVIWTVNGESITREFIGDGTSEFNNAFAGNDEIGCTVIPYDGQSEGDPVDSETGTVGNAAPEITAVQISPDTGVGGYDVVTCEVTATDTDGDSLEETFLWTQDAIELGRGSTLALSEHDVGGGDEITCTVTVSDGALSDEVSDTITLAYTPPAIEVSVVPSESGADVYCDSIVSCVTIITDPDGLDGLTVEVAWDGYAPMETGIGVTTTISVPWGFTCGEHFPGDTMGCTVEVSDPLADEIVEEYGSVTIVNRAPRLVGTPTLSPSEPRVGDTITIEGYTIVDDDGETPWAIYDWYINDVRDESAHDVTYSTGGLESGDSVFGVLKPTDSYTVASGVPTDLVWIANTLPSQPEVSIDLQCTNPALVFDGGDSDQVVIPAAAELSSFDDSLRIEAWVYWAGVNGEAWHPIASHGWGDTDAQRFWLAVSGDSGGSCAGLPGAIGRVKFGVYANGAQQCVYTSEILEPARWYHVMAQFDGSAGDLEIYLDGELAVTADALYPGSTLNHTTATPFYIGHSATEYSFHGSLAQVRYSRGTVSVPLGGYEPQWSLPVVIDTLGLWRLDEGSGATVHDATTYGNDGTITDAYWKDPGSYVSFDGSDDYVEVDASELDYGDEFTVESWVRWGGDGPTSYQVIVDHGGPADCPYRLHVEDDGSLYLSANCETALYSPDSLPLLEWAHVAIVYKDAMWRVYLNGVFQSVVFQSLTRSSDDLWFGGTGTLSEFNPFKGDIDSVRISNVARYEGTASFEPPTSFSADTNTIGLWRFETIEAGSAEDLSGGGADAVLAGAAWVDGCSGAGGVEFLTCVIDVPSTDADGDDIDYEFEWAVDDGAYGDAETSIHTGDTVPADDLSLGDEWQCWVTPTDGEEHGPAGTASIVIEADDESGGDTWTTVFFEDLTTTPDGAISTGGGGVYSYAGRWCWRQRETQNIIIPTGLDSAAQERVSVDVYSMYPNSPVLRIGGEYIDTPGDDTFIQATVHGDSDVLSVNGRWWGDSFGVLEEDSTLDDWFFGNWTRLEFEYSPTTGSFIYRVDDEEMASAFVPSVVLEASNIYLGSSGGSYTCWSNLRVEQMD